MSSQEQKSDAENFVAAFDTHKQVMDNLDEHYKSRQRQLAYGEAYLNSTWMVGLSERECKDIHFSKVYATEFAHGVPGHSMFILIAKLSDMLDAAYAIHQNCEEQRIQAEVDIDTGEAAG